MANWRCGARRSVRRTGWRRWRGTATGTWSCTSPSPAAARCCTRSTRGCTPSRSPGSPNHAEDKLLFFDLTFLPIIEAIASHCRTVKKFVAMVDRAKMPAASKVELACYEDLIDTHSDRYTWPTFDERTASSLCYTSGTNGQSEGRAVQPPVDPASRLCGGGPRRADLSSRDTVLPVVPMFHVNAWDFPTRRRWSAPRW